MNDLQEKIFNIMCKVHDICVENGIEYSLCGGSMIGAVREKGFIPWDDDMDIFMTMKNYNKFIQVAKNYQDDKIEIILPRSRKGVYYSFIKVVDKTTTLEESLFYDGTSDMTSILGAYLDVFPLIEVKSQKQAIKQLKKRGIVFKFKEIKLKKTNFNTKEKLARPFLTFFSADTFVKMLIKGYKKDKGYDFVYDPDGYCKRSAVPKKWFDKLILMPFESAEFYVIKEYDKYLTQIFGNYMQRPPVEEQVEKHNFPYINLNKPYREYIAEQENRKKL